jgi:hypothetical protein
VTLSYPTRLLDFVQDEDGVTVELAHADGSPETVHAGINPVNFLPLCAANEDDHIEDDHTRHSCHLS